MKIPFATADANVVDVTRAREEAFTEFVKGYCHYSISGVKGSTQISEPIQHGSTLLHHHRDGYQYRCKVHERDISRVLRWREQCR